MRKGAPTFAEVYRRLYDCNGKQHWWPAESPFEVMVGAVLTQNAAWANVERAIDNLKESGTLTAAAIVQTHPRRLASRLRPSGYFNIKAKRLRALCRWLLDAGDVEAVAEWSTESLRKALLGINGVGPETADDILLYAFHRPVFVIDAYTRRIFHRLGLITGMEDYETLRCIFETSLQSEVGLFNEYHALIVLHGKDVCRKRPLCNLCCLREACPSAYRDV